MGSKIEFRSAIVHKYMSTSDDIRFVAIQLIATYMNTIIVLKSPACPFVAWILA